MYATSIPHMCAIQEFLIAYAACVYGGQGKLEDGTIFDSTTDAEWLKV